MRYAQELQRKWPLLSEQLLPPEFRVLDIRHFENVDALRSAAEVTSAPVLLLIESHQVPDVLTWLSEKDDICLVDSPLSLIEHRGQWLGYRMERNLDALTRLLARQQFEKALARACENASSQHPTSLILCDVDRFKHVNDEHGHQVGDQYLKLFASALRENSDRSASVGRIGGEEFAIVCNRDMEASMMLAEKLRRKTANICTPCGVSTTASFGVTSTECEISFPALIEQANQAIYAAKAHGRNCCVSFQAMEAASRATGNDVEVIGLQNQARVLAERVANIITMKSRSILKTVREEADVDGLTGCYTRRYLDRRLAEEFEYRREYPLTVAFIDLDYFGRVNKQHGWPTGDKLLVDVCNTLRGLLRAEDWVGRYGGEEFCVVMPKTNLEDAHQVLKRILEVVDSTDFHSLDQDVVQITLSIGAAVALDSDESFSELLDRASKQALVAKRNGRNQVCVTQ